MSTRRLELPPEEPEQSRVPAYVEPDPGSFYAEERELVTICTVWSLRDALQVQRILDIAGIPFYMGKEKATGVDQVTSNFGEGVPVAVMSIAIPWIRRPMENYHPFDEPPDDKPEWPVPVTCPSCRSTDVIFERRDPEPGTREEVYTSKFEWTCGVCGHQWADDGVAKEK